MFCPAERSSCLSPGLGGPEARAVVPAVCFDLHSSLLEEAKQMGASSPGDSQVECFIAENVQGPHFFFD